MTARRNVRANDTHNAPRAAEWLARLETSLHANWVRRQATADDVRRTKETT